MTTLMGLILIVLGAVLLAGTAHDWSHRRIPHVNAALYVLISMGCIYYGSLIIERGTL